MQSMSSQSGAGFSSFSGGFGMTGPQVVRVVVNRGSLSNLSSGSGQLQVYQDASGVHIRANGQSFDSSDVTGPYVVTNENGHLERREYTKADQEFEAKQREAFRDSWNKMDEAFANNWNRFPSFGPMQPLPPMQPIPPMKPIRMRSLF